MAPTVLQDLPFLRESLHDWSNDRSDYDMTKEWNKKRRQTSCVIDKGNSPMRMSFLMNNCICQNFHLLSAELEIELETIGIATGINFCCDYGGHSSIRLDLLVSSS
jgi:hypothetical protein